LGHGACGFDGGFDPTTQTDAYDLELASTFYESAQGQEAAVACMPQHRADERLELSAGND
jgi:hypothetical protein